MRHLTYRLAGVWLVSVLAVASPHAAERTLGALREIARLEGHTRVVVDLSWKPDGSALASASWDDTIVCWDIPKRQQRWRFGSPRPMVSDLTLDAKHAVAWSPDAKWVAYGTNSGDVGLLSAETGTREGGFPVAGSIRSLAWQPTTVVLAAGSTDGSVRLWRPQEPAPFRLLAGLRHFGWALAWDKRGALLASESFGGTGEQLIPEISIVTPQGEIKRRLRGHTNEVTSVSWSGDGRTLASGGSDGTVRLWDSWSGRQLDRLSGLPGGSVEVRCRPGHRTIAIADGSERVLLWAWGGKERSGQRLPLPAGARTLEWDPGGTRLAIGMWNGTINVLSERS